MPEDSAVGISVVIEADFERVRVHQQVVLAHIQINPNQITLNRFQIESISKFRKFDFNLFFLLFIFFLLFSSLIF